MCDNKCGNCPSASPSEEEVVKPDATVAEIISCLAMLSEIADENYEITFRPFSSAVLTRGGKPSVTFNAEEEEEEDAVETLGNRIVEYVTTNTKALIAKKLVALEGDKQSILNEIRRFADLEKALSR